MSDAMAIGAMRALRDVGVSVPGDVSVVGFDDIDLAPAGGPAAHDGPSADPAQGRGGGRRAAVHRPGTRRGEARAPPARHATHRARLDRPGAPAVSVEPPGWVRDAIFYQVFPDRFASSERVHKPGPLEAWDSPPTAHGFKGGDLRGIAEHLGYLEDFGVNALYLTPIFASASNHRYHTYDYFAVDPLLGGDDALRELLDAAHDRGIRVVLDGVFNHTGRGFWPFHHVLETGAVVTLSTLVPPRRRAARRGPAAGRLPAARVAAVHPRLRGVVEPAGPAQAQHRRARGSRVPVPGGRALAPVRDRRLAARRPGRDRRRGLLAGVPAPLPRRAPGCLPRRRDLAGGARLAARRPVRRPDELPAGRGHPGVRRWQPPGHGRHRASSRVLGERPPARWSGLRRADHGARRGIRPGRPRRSSSTSSARTTRPGFERCSGAASTGSCSRRCSR